MNKNSIQCKLVIVNNNEPNNKNYTNKSICLDVTLTESANNSTSTPDHRIYQVIKDQNEELIGFIWNDKDAVSDQGAIINQFL